MEEGQYVEDDEDSYDQYRCRRDEEEPNSTIMLRGLSPETHEHDVSFPCPATSYSFPLDVVQ